MPIPITAFESAGLASEQILEVIVGITLKTVTNYVGSGLELPLHSSSGPIHGAPRATPSAPETVGGIARALAVLGEAA